MMDREWNRGAVSGLEYALDLIDYWGKKENKDELVRRGIIHLRLQYEGEVKRLEDEIEKGESLCIGKNY